MKEDILLEITLKRAYCYNTLNLEINAGFFLCALQDFDAERIQTDAKMRYYLLLQKEEIGGEGAKQYLTLPDWSQSFRTNKTYCGGMIIQESERLVVHWHYLQTVAEEGSSYLKPDKEGIR